MAEPIKPVINGTIGKIIQKLDKKLPENNPSIFMKPQDTDDTTITNDFIFNQLYKT